MASHIRAHFDNNNILSDLEHGFRKKRSCETQLILTANNIANGLKGCKQIDAILLDFSKAFGKVSHTHILYKLKFYDIHDNTLSWITDFLNNHTQKVVVGGKESIQADVTSGVLQGTVLGPLLFLAYVNDIHVIICQTLRGQ